MTKKPTYLELEQRVEELERAVVETREANETIRAAEAEKNSILDAMSDIVLAQDTNMVIRWGNEAAGRSVGKTQQELIGHYCYELWHGSKKPCKECPVLSALETGSHAKSITMTPDGRCWELKGEPVRNRNGEIVGAIEIARDITERKQAEESLQKSEEQYRLLADNVIDVISHHSRDGTVLYVSPSVSALLGYEPSELIGTNGFDPLIPPDDMPKIQSKIISLLEEEPSLDQIEHRLIKKNGIYVWVETTSRLRQNNNNDKSFEIISVTREITERKQANLALQEKEQKLERQAQHLEEVNTALKVLLEHREEEKKKLEENILSNMQKLIFPYIEKLENSRLDDKNKTYFDIIRSNLKELISPFTNTLSSKYAILTSTEIQVADLIKHGRTSKEIASLLNVSPKAVSFHRGNIRRKLGLANKKINLRSHLQSLAM